MSRITPAGKAIRDLLSDGEWHTRSEINVVAVMKVLPHFAMRKYFHQYSDRVRTKNGDVAVRAVGAVLIIGQILSEIAEKSDDGYGSTRRWRLRVRGTSDDEQSTGADGRISEATDPENRSRSVRRLRRTNLGMQTRHYADALAVAEADGSGGIVAEDVMAVGRWHPRFLCRLRKNVVRQ